MRKRLCAYEGQKMESLLLKRTIQEICPGTEIRECRRASGGCINACSIVELSNGRMLFIKEQKSALPGLFLAESRGLQALRSDSGPLIPEVLYVKEEKTAQILVLEYIEQSGLTNPRAFFEDFGHRLAALHRSKPSARCGFETSNHIGATVQINNWQPDWISFFIEARLVPQLSLALQKGRIDNRSAKGLERLISKLDSLLHDSGEYCLIHGDLWSGNFLCGPENRPVLIDPAVSYSEREADLAMTELFGGFPPIFYKAYNEAWPLETGYMDRRDIYNLYHNLNHLNLFGSSYLAAIQSCLQRHGCL